MSVRYAYEDDNGGRRSWLNRRQFHYAAHIPERRKNPERRFEKDRRHLAQQLQSRRPSGSWDARRVIVFPGLTTGR
jgi:hypothetical protein